MNLIEFNKILKKPAEIKKEETRGLEQILQEYPFFQSARFLHLYGLKKQHSFKYNDALKKTAAYTNDRALLFDYITSFDFDFHAAPATQTISEPENSPSATGEAKAASTTEATSSAKDEAEEAGINSSHDAEAGKEKTPEETLGLGQPLEFNRSETFSFNEWLQLSQFEPIDREEKKGEPKAASPVQRSKKNMELVDEFIAKQPKIKPSESDTYQDISLEGSTDNEHLMTETLAHVYVEQKKYEKAITAFTILSLKYPEKSSFFADQIQAIRELQNI